MPKMGKNRKSKQKYPAMDDITEDDVRYNVRKGYGNGLYMLEKILDKRQTNSGKTLYLIKWMGYSSKENTWEPPENVDPGSLRQFEEELAKKKNLNDSGLGLSRAKAGLKRKRRASSSPARSVSVEEDNESLTPEESIPEVPPGEESESEPEAEAVDGQLSTKIGFRMLSPETNFEGRVLQNIIGLTECQDKMFYLVEFEGQRLSSLVESDDMIRHFPSPTIRFLEEHTEYISSSEL